MATVRYKVPSQAASGSETFADNLVGVQITDGSSQMTMTSFAIDNIIPEKDSKKFKTSPFSDFLTLDNLKQESDAPTTISTQEKQNQIVFKGAKDDAGKSLFGSLKSRLLVSITRIVNKFPAGIVLNVNGPIGGSLNSAFNISYNVYSKTTQFQIENSKLFNPFDVVLTKPNSNTLIETDNPIRNLYSSYKKYVLDISGTTYDIVDYVQPNNNIITFTVNGKPFGDGTTYNQNLLFRPNNGITEEFFNNLDDVEGTLLTKDTNPKYNAGFYIPKDTFDNSNTALVRVEYNWPISEDNWNLEIVGLKYDQYLKNLSDTADLIDDYKSNLMVRFLSAPQLFEYDTPDQKMTSVFQLYGQSFDRVKKYIDNIAFMRNISYDGINNLPDILLKNLANNLGLDTINLFDENTIDQTLYTRSSNQYSGVPEGKTFIEAEYEFYRRMLVNLAHIYKSKGTKSSINFFLKFLGAPDQLISIDEYVYEVTNLPKLNGIENQIYDVIQGNKKNVILNFDPTGFTYTQTIYKPSTTFVRSDYPIDEITGLPRRANNTTSDIFFQKGSGWYDITLNHRTPDILDTKNSILTGRTKTIKTIAAPYTYGEQYFDTFRTLPGLDSGFELTSRVDNIKGSIDDTKSSYILNRKNISIHLDSANGVNFDIYRKSRDLLLTFGSNTLHPQTGVTFAEFVGRLLSEQIPNSNVIRYKKNYITLEDVYQSYISSTGFTPYNINDVHEFINKMSPYWTSLIEQIIPSTTLWSGGNLIQNSVFGRSKYAYRSGCQPKIIVEKLYPDFPKIINDDLHDLIGYEENFRGIIDIARIYLYPVIEIDGIPYSSTTHCVKVRGRGNTSDNAKLYDPLTGITGCTVLPFGVYGLNSLPLISGYECFYNPDFTQIKNLWLRALTGLIDDVINKRYSGYTAGYENYDPYLNTTGQTSSLVTDPILNYSIFTDIDGVQKIKFSSLKYGPNSCTIMKSFSYTIKTQYDPFTPFCTYGVYPEVMNPQYTGGTFDVDILLHNVTPIGSIKPNTDRYYIYSGNSPTLYNGLEYVDSCTQKITGFTTTSIGDLLFLDASNCQVKMKFTHRDTTQLGNVNVTFTSQDTLKPYTCVIDSKTASTTSTYSAITLNVVYDNPTYYGLKWDTILKKYVDSSYVDTPIYEIKTGDTIQVVEYIPNSQIINKNIVNGLSVNNLTNVAFTTKNVMVTNVTTLASIKTYSITGYSQINGNHVFEVLPTTKLRVYTRYNVNDHDPILTDSYFFDSRYPKDLQITPSQITPCCNYPLDYYVKGDFLIGSSGELINVIGISLNYEEPNMYYDIAYDQQNSNLCVFNGTINKKIITETKFCTSETILVEGVATDQVCYLNEDYEIITDVYGTIQITVKNGTPPYYYSWYDSSGTLISNNQNIDQLVNDEYTVYVTDSCNSTSGPVLFIVNPGDYCV